MKEENVYEETTRAEETVAVSEKDADRKSVDTMNSTVLGKFKDVDALVRAYGSLQAEFTRRSQRLKELERKVENSERSALSEGDSGVEKLRKNALARKAETKRFDEFMANTMHVNAQATEENAQMSESQGLKYESLEKDAPKDVDGHTMYELNDLAQQTVGKPEKEEDEGKEKTEEVGYARGEELRKSVAKSGNAIDSFESLYEQVNRNEGVRLKIIGEYLSSLGKSSAPLMTGGVGVFAAPPKKPASISAAGDMALLYFKKPKN